LLKPANLGFEESRSQASIFAVVVQDMVDCDEHLAGDLTRQGLTLHFPFAMSHFKDVSMRDSPAEACSLVKSTIILEVGNDVFCVHVDVLVLVIAPVAGVNIRETLFHISL